VLDNYAWKQGFPWGLIGYSQFNKLHLIQISDIFKIKGNVEQSIKWDPAFQRATTEKYVNLSLSAKEEKPVLVVWLETAVKKGSKGNS
jgi:apolipoprotein N-acyltransferase